MFKVKMSSKARAQEAMMQMYDTFVRKPNLMEQSLYSLNKARKTMREAMGLTLDDNIEYALERYMLMHDFLVQAEKIENKLTTKEKQLKIALSNSFGFGGNNATIIIGK